MAGSSIKQYGSDKQAASIKEAVVPTAEQVETMHTNADTDTRKESLHHTLGPGNNQAAPGNHKHDGGDSEFLLSGVTISGSRGGNVALVSVIQALVKLGATDSTTP